MIDFGINAKKTFVPTHAIYPERKVDSNGFIVPFGDGPAPLYNRGVSKFIIQNMLANATRYAYITTPYLIIDNDMCQSIESAALRGVDVKIVLPHVPDKKIIFSISQSFYHRLMSAGVKIYEYEPGFIHAKNYLVDDKYGMIGTINLDYRSLVHHFENGVWMYNTDCLEDMKKDLTDIIDKSIEIEPSMIKMGWLKRFLRSIIRIFAPLM
jgi:cardiolipin synthase